MLHTRTREGGRVTCGSLRHVRIVNQHEKSFMEEFNEEKER